MTNRITVNNIGFTFPKKNEYIFKNISFEISAGSALAIIGMNGSGKTTLLKIILGIYEPTNGEIVFEENDKKSLLIQNKGIIGYLPQNENIPSRMKVQDYIDLGRIPFYSLFSLPEMRENSFENILTELNIEGFKNIQLGDLSGGELQRVRLARVLVQNPKIIIFDEPSTHLDLSSRQMMFSIMKSLKKRGLNVIFSSNEPNEALKHSDITLMLNKKCKYHFGLTKEVVTAKRIEEYFLVKSEITKLHENTQLNYL